MEIVLLWCFVLAWMAKRGAEDLVHAVKGTPNPRYELKKQRAAAGGQPVKGQPRYGTKEWAADLYTDALAAHTEKRRQAARSKAQPIDDLADAVRESKPERVYDPNNTRNCPTCKGEVVLDGRPCPRCLAEQQRRNAEWEAQGGLARVFGSQLRASVSSPEEREEKPVSLIPDNWTIDRDSPTGRHLAGEWCGNPNCDCACKQCLARMTEPGRSLCNECLTAPDTRPDARIIRFPNPKNIEKEIIMANSEVTGLSTAIAYADAVSKAHESFTSAGAEGYVGALEQGGNGPEVVSSAREAMEASSIATGKWAVHRQVLEKQLNVREAYQGNPDAGNKQFVVNE